ncbi:MAG: hypothetical protein J6Y20_10950, partial [Lachnospiraceae bacterium]|nr:hypothetical protein [Lachnospiraceae bacterium]
MATGSRATDKWFKDKKQEQATAPTGRATDKWFQQAGQNSDYYKFHNIGTGSATRSLSDIYGTETTRRTSASAPVIPEAEQKRQTERESASTARDNAKNRLNELEGEKSRLAGYVTDDFSASLYADRLAELDRQIAEARTTHEAAKQEYDKVYTDYNAARKELKEAEAAARSAERSNAYNSTERKKEADERVAKARAAYSEQGGDPDADWLSANLKQWGAGMLGTLRYGQELNRPENAIKLGPVTIGGGDDRMPAEMRAAIEAKQKADYEEKYGAGTWKPAYQRTEETAARMQREAAEDLSSIKAGRSELAQFGIDVAGQSVQMGLDAAFNVGKVIPGGSLTAMALRTFGASAQEAKDEGATLAQQGLYGAGSAAVEVLTERMFDGVAKIYGAGVADDLVSHMVGKFTKNRLGQVALGWAFDAIGEGFEEVVSDLANPFLRSIYDKDVASNLYTGSFADRWSGYWGQIDPAEVGYDFLVGAAMGFAGGSVENVGRATGIVAEDERSKFFMEAGQSGMQFKDAVKMWKQHLIKEGYATQTQDTEVTNQANEYLARLGEGKKV